MPTYLFHCTECNAHFDEMLSMDHRNDPVACPVCGKVAERIITAPMVLVHTIPIGAGGRFRDVKTARDLEKALAKTTNTEDKTKINKELSNLGGKE